jgi:hypothetical protein
MRVAKVAAPQNNNNDFNVLMKDSGGYMTPGGPFLRQL